MGFSAIFIQGPLQIQETLSSHWNYHLLLCTSVLCQIGQDALTRAAVGRRGASVACGMLWKGDKGFVLLFLCGRC